MVENVIGKVKSGINAFVGKIDDVVNDVKNAFANAKSGGLKRLFDELVDNIKTLPERMGGVGGIIRRLLEKLSKFDGIPVVAAAKRVVRRARNFVDAVRSDVMGLYNAIVDSVTVDLPYAAKEIWASIQVTVTCTARRLFIPGYFNLPVQMQFRNCGTFRTGLM